MTLHERQCQVGPDGRPVDVPRRHLGQHRPADPHRLLDVRRIPGQREADGQRGRQARPGGQPVLQLGVRPDGWREVAGVYGEDGSRRSAADVTDADTLAEVRAFKQAAKATKKAKG